MQEQPPHFRGQGGSREELPLPEVRGGGREELPNVQGAVAMRAQEGLEELFPDQGQKRWKWYPSSKVKSSGCALLEQP